ncbi:hypothetical protein [Paraburkholderia susongensis]|uniref:Uncharacterized protein n=1 Tax=Paraburkholderia susongensis TaxID=1515439 RepID=A0A1X7LX85_9BURK|nr:hypothetical protein [Paraburkholderia susongensis]SMG58067.1 hypothetical protein SAMN06265784_110186 [Paraburkholderia susongensis]
MLPFLSLHALAAQRGDGLRPELLALFERYANPGFGLQAAIEPEQIEVFASEAPCDESPASGSCAPSKGR